MEEEEEEVAVAAAAIVFTPARGMTVQVSSLIYHRDTRDEGSDRSGRAEGPVRGGGRVGC